MIFKIFFWFIYSGNSAIHLLLGSYFMEYTGAGSLDLAYIFMIGPIVMFARPLVCAQADRFQCHKKLLVWFLFIHSFAYLPYLALPYLLRNPAYAAYLSSRVNYWSLAAAHLIGSVGFCGVRALGDALAINYAKQVGDDFGTYRKFGSMSAGTFGYLLGQINQDWILPNFLPTFITLCVSFSLLGFLVLIWPDEHFKITSQASCDGRAPDCRRLVQGSQVWSIVGKKFMNLIACRPLNRGVISKNAISLPTTTNTTVSVSYRAAERERRYLSVRQQVAIFTLLLRRDFRILLYLILIIYGGMAGYAPQGFVFTYLNQVCHQTGACDAASLSGSALLLYCLIETPSYMLIQAYRKYLNYTVMLAATLVSITFHYYFYGFVLPHVSPYFFLLEGLHGIEYSFSLVSCVELGYKFGSRVELLLPELVERGIIGPDDEHELVKLSLMATMSSCFTLAYDGLGTIIGCYLYGLVADKYSYTTAWILVGSLGAFGLLLLGACMLLGSCCNLKSRLPRLEFDSSKSAELTL